MFLFSPEKLLVILVVAMLVVGPEKLPKVARQIGAFWNELHKFRARLEREAKEVFPDLPAFDTLTQAVRSPLSYLDRLADAGPVDTAATEPDAVTADRDRDVMTARPAMALLDTDPVTASMVADPTLN
jgi:sec-independent protein translocase protein TatB